MSEGGGEQSNLPAVREASPVAAGGAAVATHAAAREGFSLRVKLLIGARVAGYLGAWAALALVSVAAIRVLRERPATLDSTLVVMLRGELPRIDDEDPLPDARDPRHQAARNLMQDGDERRAETLLRTLLRETPDHAAFNYDLGRLLLASGRGVEGRRYLARAALVAPEDPDGAPSPAVVQAALAAQRFRAGDRAGGREARQAAEAQGADLRKATLERGRLALREGDFERALFDLLVVDTEGVDADVQVDLARAYLGKARQRIDQFLPSMLSFMKSDWARQRFADKGSLDEARRHLDRALELDPDHPQALALRSQL